MELLLFKRICIVGILFQTTLVFVNLACVLTNINMYDISVHIQFTAFWRRPLLNWVNVLLIISFTWISTLTKLVELIAWSFCKAASNPSFFYQWLAVNGFWKVMKLQQYSKMMWYAQYELYDKLLARCTFKLYYFLTDCKIMKMIGLKVCMMVM